MVQAKKTQSSLLTTVEIVHTVHYKTCYACAGGCNRVPGCEFNVFQFADNANISRYSVNKTYPSSNKTLATTTFNIINGNGDTKLIQREGNQNTTIMYLIESNRTFFIMKSNKEEHSVEVRLATFFKDHNMTILVGYQMQQVMLVAQAFLGKKAAISLLGETFHVSLQKMLFPMKDPF